MRRTIALVLSMLFLLQAPASAGPISAPNVQPLLSAIQSTWIFAVITGQSDRYAAMHAPAFAIPKLHDDGLRPTKVLATPVSLTMTTPRVGKPGIGLTLPKPLSDTPSADPLLTSAKSTQAHSMRSSLRPSVRALPRAGARRLQAGSTLAPSTTGINRWWTYEEKPLAGVGKAMVNVANGNLIVQADDVDVPERGIDLAFRRSNNSQSSHDAANTDGSGASVFGNGWTNNLDAHMGYNETTNTLSVYDIDGARYDYNLNPNMNWSAPITPANSPWISPGMPGTALYWDGYDGYYWEKKSGTKYDFWAPFDIADLSASDRAYEGRVFAIWGRNKNNNIRFVYSWANGDSSNAQNITQIIAQHSDGQRLTLGFCPATGCSGGSGPTELASITLPDNLTKVTYTYDATGNLTTVTRPGNSSYQSLIEMYWYYGGTHLMHWVGGPRFVASWNGGGWADGSNYGFNYDVNSTSGRLTWIQDYGKMNFTPSDGAPVPTPLQSSAPMNGNSLWRQTSFQYNYNSTGETAVTDTQGHVRWWLPDSLGRIVEAAEWARLGDWLVTYASWDANNNVTASVDARGNQTDYTYDAAGINTIKVQLPSVQTSLGTGRPTSLYAYDGRNNLVAYCDPQYVWTSGAQTCSPVAGTTHYTYDTSDASEPDGKLTDTYTPMGYDHHITYDTNQGDYGLPIQVQGGPTGDNARTPTQTFTYDPFGNLATYNSGNGTWTLTYDKLNRLVVRSDPDNGTAACTSTCNTTSYTTYNNDGSVSKTETAYQRANGWGSTFAYDANGDVVSETAWRTVGAATTPTAQITTKWYDGEDRLVEVQQQKDINNDTYTNAWITRYIYDLTNGANQTFNGAGSFQAYGNLFKTQELLPSGTGVVTQTANTPQSIANTQFQDLKGNAFDALDRPLTKYSLVNVNGTETLSTETMTYDGTNANGTFSGELTSDCSALSQCTYPGYDALGRTNAVSFSDASSPTRTSTFDPDGRTMSITSSVYGTQSYTYDNDGRKLTEQEASGGGVTSPAKFTHQYYADGMLKQLDVQSSALNQTGLFAYSYRADGRVQTQTINDAAQANVGSTSVAFTYDASGRIMQRAETGTGANATPSTWTYDAYGRTATINLPTCSACPSSTTVGPYDPQGQLLKIGVGSGGVNQNFTNYSYSTRGELVNSTRPVSTTPTQPIMANGIQAMAFTGGNPAGGSASTSWDSRSGEMLSKTSNIPLIVDGQQEPNPTTSNFAYDQVGRMTSEANSLNNGNEVDTLTRSYDAENHTTTSADLIATGSNSTVQGMLAAYNWGPTGHVIRVGSATGTSAPGMGAVQYDTLHWDGDQLIFQTNASGQVDDIKIGTSGDITPQDPTFTGLTFWDRAPDNTITECHNVNGAGQFFAPGSGINGGKCGPVFGPTSFIWTSSQYSPTKSGQPNYSVGVGQGKLLGMYRTDGMTDGLNTLQGVRTMDSNAGTWTTPDAYSGDVDDPSSQKSYMWNGNNPVGYSDPSGYTALFRPAEDEGFDILSPDQVFHRDPGTSNESSGGAKDPPTPQTAATPEKDPYAMGDFGSRPGDANAADWGKKNYKEANAPGVDPGYEIGTVLHAANGFKADTTLGGGNGNEVDLGKDHPMVGDALVHSHGHYTGDRDFSDHVDTNLKDGFSAVYTLSKGYLWVQWIDGAGLHGKPEQIYNVCAAMGGKCP